METCCGYGYELVRLAEALSLIFKVPPDAHGHSENCCALRNTKTHSLFKKIPGPRLLIQKRQLFPEFGWASQALFVLPREIRGSQRLRYQVQEYGPDSLSAVDAALIQEKITAPLNNASTKP